MGASLKRKTTIGTWKSESTSPFSKWLGEHYTGELLYEI
jgi:hypothetical protein